MAQYDVFVSYHGTEQIYAVDLAERLRGMGLRVWFDKWHLQPGKRWLPELESALFNSHAVAVLVGVSGPGPWQEVEVESAMRRFQDSGNPVIPVLLPGTEKANLPSHLDRHTAIEFSADGLAHDALAQLVWAITGRRLKTSVDQFGEEFDLIVPAAPHHNSQIRPRTLPNPVPGSLLHTTWETLGSGIELLIEQIKSYGGRLDVDACVGINEAGLVMATFLAASQFNRCAVGYLKCNKVRDTLTLSNDSFYPTLGTSPTIFICDFEVKYSDVIGYIAANLREQYEIPDLYFAVFGALTENPSLRPPSFSGLTGARVMTGADLCGIFIAGTMAPPGIEPPLELR